MKFLWCDTETTGLETSNAAPFQVAFIFCYSQKLSDGNLLKEESERVFNLNCLDIPGIEYSEEAGKIHGYTKGQIESFESSKSAVAKINSCLNDFMNYKDNQPMFFCGYNSSSFDWNHLVSLFKKYGYDFSRYFYSQKLDVFEQVKEAGKQKVLPYLENLKLTTIAKFLNIKMDNAHDALCDIRATREVAKSLTSKGIKLK